jgi:protein SCO1
MFASGKSAIKMKRPLLVSLAAAAAAAVVFLALAPGAAAQLASDPMQSVGVRPELLKQVGIDQKLNQSIPLDLTFRDEDGRTVALGQFFGQKPVILTLVYYNCPMLCTQVLNGVESSLKELSTAIGNQYDVVTISIDPTESHVLAKTKKEMYVGMYGRPGAAQGWHFLTGDEPQIKQLADAIGFRYAYDPDTKQFAHASAIMLLTPDGKISRYFYGIQYPTRDLRLGLVEASEGKIGTPVDQVLLFCYHYDPATGKYGLLISHVIQIGGALTVLILGVGMLILFRGEHYALPHRKA